MATLFITELTDFGRDAQNTPASIASIADMHEQVVNISGSSTPSAVFDAGTAIVRLHPTAACSVKFGVAPVVETTNLRMAAGSIEYFRVPVGAGYQVAVIAN